MGIVIEIGDDGSTNPHETHDYNQSCVEKDKWLVAAHKELDLHLINGTWKVMPRSKSKKKPLTLRWGVQN